MSLLSGSGVVIELRVGTTGHYCVGINGRNREPTQRGEESGCPRGIYATTAREFSDDRRVMGNG
jgi:hypothetical protein